jgi:hypothetical protein
MDKAIVSIPFPPSKDANQARITMVKAAPRMIPDAASRKTPDKKSVMIPDQLEPRAMQMPNSRSPRSESPETQSKVYSRRGNRFAGTVSWKSGMLWIAASAILSTNGLRAQAPPAQSPSAPDLHRRPKGPIRGCAFRQCKWSAVSSSMMSLRAWSSCEIKAHRASGDTERLGVSPTAPTVK